MVIFSLKGMAPAKALCDSQQIIEQSLKRSCMT
jgi:hypothetical protein